MIDSSSLFACRSLSKAWTLAVGTPSGCALDRNGGCPGDAEWRRRDHVDASGIRISISKKPDRISVRSSTVSKKSAMYLESKNMSSKNRESSDADRICRNASQISASKATFDATARKRRGAVGFTVGEINNGSVGGVSKRGSVTRIVEDQSHRYLSARQRQSSYGLSFPQPAQLW